LDKRFDDESAGEIVCTCMYSECEVAVGFSLSEPPNGDPESASVGYLYVAGRCQECGLCGVYGEWPPDGDFPYRQFVQSV
jgi:hypothetical protein